MWCTRTAIYKLDNSLSTHHQRPSALEKRSLGSGQSGSTAGSTVVSTLHDDNVVSLRVRPRHLDGGFDRFGTRVPKEKRVKRRVGHHCEQRFDELNVWLGKSDSALNVDDGRCLRDDGCSHVGMRVTEGCHSDSRCKVEQLLIVLHFSESRSYANKTHCSQDAQPSPFFENMIPQSSDTLGNMLVGNIYQPRSVGSDRKTLACRGEQRNLGRGECSSGHGQFGVGVQLAEGETLSQETRHGEKRIVEKVVLYLRVLLDMVGARLVILHGAQAVHVFRCDESRIELSQASKETENQDRQTYKRRLVLPKRRL